MIVKPGLEVLRDDGYQSLLGLRVGLMTNPSAVDHELNSAYLILSEANEVRLTTLFGPEHGFSAAAPDAEKVASTTDPRTGLPIYSLFGGTYRPTANMLKDVDIIVCDIQDIGVRYYTFAWTISYILEAAGRHDVPVVVLDRPNPLGGLIVDGPSLDPHLSTLVGRYPVPVIHGMSLGELMWMVNATWNPTPARLVVVPCENWKRSMVWVDTGLPWVPPSPGIPHLSTLQHYPGACLVEGTNLSEGRGTALPFEIVGAPWIDALQLVQELNSQEWSARMGVRFRPHTFQPTMSKFSGAYCHGVQVYVTDLMAWRPIHVWLGVILTIRRMYPEQFMWLPPYKLGGMLHFDRLIGSKVVREGVEAGVMLDEITGSWDSSVASFRGRCQQFLLYGV